MEVRGQETRRRQMHSVRSRRTRHIRPAIDQDPALRPARKRYGLSSQNKQLPVGEILFPNLDEVGAASHCATHAGDERQARQLAAVGDIVEKRALNGKSSRGCFS